MLQNGPIADPALIYPSTHLPQTATTPPHRLPAAAVTNAGEQGRVFCTVFKCTVSGCVFHRDQYMPDHELCRVCFFRALLGVKADRSAGTRGIGTFWRIHALRRAEWHVGTRFTSTARCSTVWRRKSLNLRQGADVLRAPGYIYTHMYMYIHI